MTVITGMLGRTGGTAGRGERVMATGDMAER